MLLIKCNAANFSGREYRMLREGILKQREDGVIVVPSFCDVMVVPPEMDVKIVKDDEV